MSTEIATVESKSIDNPEPRNPGDVIKVFLDHSQDQLSKALAGRIDPDEFARICLTTFRKGGDRMAKVSPTSFLAACMEAAQVGLRPEGVLGECWIIPRRGQAHFQLGYQGALKLATRGDVEKIEARVAFDDEEFSVSLGTSPAIIHTPKLGEKLKGRHIVAAYAVATFGSGKTQFEVVDRDELDRTAERSGDPRDRTPSDVWRSYPVAMAKKTAILRLCKALPNPDHNAKRLLQQAEFDIAVGAVADRKPAPKTLGEL